MSESQYYINHYVALKENIKSNN